MAQLPQSFCLDLAYSFTGDTEVAAYLLKSAATPVFKPESQLKDSGLPIAKRAENVVDLFFEQLVRSSLGGR